NRRCISLRLQYSPKGRGRQPATIIHRYVDHGVSSEPEKPYRAVDRAMALGAAHDPYWRRAGQALALDIPSPLGEQSVSCSRQTGDVRHLRAGDEGKAGCGRQTEQFFEPTPADLFNYRFGGAASMYRPGLIPSRPPPHPLP